MSFFCPITKEFITQVIIDKIMIKIRDIQSHSDWINFDISRRKEDFDISKISNDYIVKQLKIWENIAKLSIDLCRDYDYYRQFVFESRFNDPEYSDRLKNLGYVCVNGRWQSECKPCDDVVQMNVFLYCLYRQLSSTDAILVCCFCSQPIEANADKCEVCNSPITDIKDYAERIENANKDNKEMAGMKINDVERLEVYECVKDNLTKETNEIRNERDINNEQILSEDVIKDGNIAEIRNEIDIHNELILEEDEIEDGNIAEIMGTVAVTKQNEDGTKWKCGKCECPNEYSLGNCEACGGVYIDGTWICGGCTMRNSCMTDVCTTCYVLNDKLAVDKEDRKERCDKCGSVKNEGGKQCGKCNRNDDDKVWKDKWKCGRCGMFWGLEIDICTDCGASKIGRGVWRCGNCTLENKWEDQKCTVCDAPNNNFGAKNCVSCKKNRVGPGKDRCVDCDKNTTNKDADGKWQCKYPNCNVSNNNTDRYCGTCRLIRDYSRGRGDSVKVWFEDKEISMWICVKCAKINKEHELVCHRCAETRYKKRYCKPCKVYNDGTTNNCVKCYKRLL